MFKRCSMYYADELLLIWCYKTSPNTNRQLTQAQLPIQERPGPVSPGGLRPAPSNMLLVGIQISPHTHHGIPRDFWMLVPTIAATTISSSLIPKPKFLKDHMLLSATAGAPSLLPRSLRQLNNNFCADCLLFQRPTRMPLKWLGNSTFGTYGSTVCA